MQPQRTRYSYNPADWYWCIGGDTTRVYSSSKAGYVSVTDPDYIAWSARDDTRITNIATYNDLKGVLSRSYPNGLLVPLSVPMVSARVILIRLGKMDAVKAALAAIPGVEGQEAREWFEFSLTMKRDHPLISQLKPVLQWTDADIDDMFIAARSI